MAKYCTQSTV